MNWCVIVLFFFFFERGQSDSCFWWTDIERDHKVIKRKCVKIKIKDISKIKQKIYN